MQNIELVIFDMAGTVVDEGNVVYKTLQQVINNEGFDVTLDFVLEFGAGKEKHQAIKDILEEIGIEDFEVKSNGIFEKFKVLLAEAYKALEVASYDGVEELIQDLKHANVKVVLNTGYDKATAQLLLGKMKWDLGVHYDTLVTADDVENGRPNPDMIFEAMKQTNITEPSKVLKAGDSIIDIEEGKNADCGLTVGVTTGAHTAKQLASANPDFVLESLSELRGILLK
ncbi:phosphonatase-like hydrolase [Mangrovimonas sp. TPBH4]|uniref:phosphonatase-like hydrolase n=1 Tax=Mangrovimonas sp. TPBH4 TaxID=1645914 RepID=UPI0006B6847C|nr:phosphonatase-like hydrolase [Mangrovimonas sp. TPBH4]